MEELLQKLKTNNLIDAMENIILERYENGQVQVVELDTFNIFFGDVFDDPTYERLLGDHTFQWGEPPQTLTYNADQMGYQKYFDEWRTLGII